MQDAQIVDFTSDTGTLPTTEMLDAMREAPLGDDVYGWDPTVNRLEALAAQMMGKEAGLFVASGTMGNLIALMAHTHAGQEVILEADSHLYYNEGGGMARLAGLSPRLVHGRRGIIGPSDVIEALRKPDIHYPETALLCLENTHSRGGGSVMPVETMEEICALAKHNHLRTHLDGARIFNAALALQADVKKLAEPFDSVMFCISKGLSAPVGSLLVGEASFIERGRRVRKLLGGGMRQVGVLAAAGIVALETMIDRLEEDHTNARELGRGLSKIEGIKWNLETVQTNIVQFEVADLGVSIDTFAALLLARGLKVSKRPPTAIRMVTHRHISSRDIVASLETIAQVCSSLR